MRLIPTYQPSQNMLIRYQLTNTITTTDKQSYTKEIMSIPGVFWQRPCSAHCANPIFSTKQQSILITELFIVIVVPESNNLD